jgi:hypothetical protein
MIPTEGVMGKTHGPFFVESALELGAKHNR